MARVTVYMTISDADLQAGWQDDASEFEASVKATLQEVIGNDGNPYVPHFYGVDVEDDDA